MAVDYRDPMIILFREAFEGWVEGNDYTWFVEGKEGIFDAVEHTSAEKASRQPAEDCNSIAAHLNHVRYTLSLTNGHIRGENPESDWEGSWTKQQFSEEEWAQLANDLRSEYESVLSFLETRPEWPEQSWLTGAMALIPHMAYHLGAVRQLIKVVR